MADLKYTLEQARIRELEMVGIKGRPYRTWPGGVDTNDCVGHQTERLGLRTGRETLAQLSAQPWLISISAFRAHYGWQTIAADDLKAGDLVLSNWTGSKLADGTLEPEHMEWAYAVRPGYVEIVGANTGPRVGQPSPNGIWRKVRPLDEHIVLGIRVPYAGAPLTSPYGAKPPTPGGLSKRQVKAVAAWLNEPGRVRGYLKKTGAVEDGVPGDIYWTLVQQWGHENRLYGVGFVIDGEPGPRTRQVEAIILKRATAKTAHRA